MNVNQVSFDFVGVNACDQYLSAPENHTPLLAVFVKLDWSILSVLPTAVNDTREGEGVTRELATGSITSSRVMEFISNQASEMFQATQFCHRILANAVVASLVIVTVQSVQSLVPVSRFVNVEVRSVADELYVVIANDAEFVATFVVFTQQESLYFVLGFIGVPFFDCSGIVPAEVLLQLILPVAFVVDSLRVFAPVLVTAVSNSALTVHATTVI